MTDVTQTSGTDVIKQALKTMPSGPGVYRMLSKQHEILYVGKAKNLKKRVTHYTQLKRLGPRLRNMVEKTCFVEITTTASEAEALLLEANLIKHHKPDYNILLKDGKSFPYITITNHEFSRVAKHRGEQKKGHVYFGPFASASDVNKAITSIQKAFLVRPCPDSVFASRSRPCLEYQIKRCSAPCVGYISKEEYDILVEQAQAFLSGKNRDLQMLLEKKMEEASAAMEYEKAATYRDRIKALTAIQGQQYIHTKSVTDADILAICKEGDQYCIQVFFVRAGHMRGNKAFFPKQTEGYDVMTVMENFIGRFYQSHPAPSSILLNVELPNKTVIEDALTSITKKKVQLYYPQKGEKKRLMDMVERNAKESLTRKLQETSTEQALLQKIETLFELEKPISRIEVYDNSHIMGKHAVGAMIVAGVEGFETQHYRRFTVKPSAEDAASIITGGDDYVMMEQVLTRRFTRLQKEMVEKKKALWPDIILIDGGKGQVGVAHRVLDTLGIFQVKVIGIAKGKKRNAGKETFYIEGKEPFHLDPEDPVLHYLQRLRDEAHRYAIFSHRKKRDKAMQTSSLDAIPGIGAVRKKALLHYFGSAAAVARASKEDIAKVPGINQHTATDIYEYLHTE